MGNRARTETQERTGGKTSPSRVIDLERDPAPDLPAVIHLPREEVLATLREVQDLSWRRALWGRPFGSKFSEAVERLRKR